MSCLGWRTIAGMTWLPLQCQASQAAGLDQCMFYKLEFSSHRNISRSDLCPSTTVSSSTSTGTLTDTGTITEVKLCPKSVFYPLLKEHPAPAPAPWRACAICLEDMVDSDLVSHIHCTAVLCR